MELARQLNIYWLKVWEHIVDFCNKNANVATVLGVIIAIIGFFLGLREINELVQKQKEKKEFHNEFESPVKNRPTSEKMDAYINASDNGVSEIEVKENE